MRHVKAKTIVQAVTRATMGRYFSSEARYGTLLQRRLAFVECAERSQDWWEYLRTLTALRRYSSVREAVKRGDWINTQRPDKFD